MSNNEFSIFEVLRYVLVRTYFSRNTFLLPIHFWWHFLICDGKVTTGINLSQSKCLIIKSLKYTILIKELHYYDCASYFEEFQVIIFFKYGTGTVQYCTVVVFKIYGHEYDHTI